MINIEISILLTQQIVIYICYLLIEFLNHCVIFLFRSELVCKVKYNNTLPDIPFDPKFITYPFDPNRYV